MNRDFTVVIVKKWWNQKVALQLQLLPAGGRRVMVDVTSTSVAKAAKTL